MLDVMESECGGSARACQQLGIRMYFSVNMCVCVSVRVLSERVAVM